MSTLELTASARLKGLLKNRYIQMAVLVLMLAGYVVAIVAGVVGSPVGSSNFSIVFVWIAWWAALILVAVPLLGRGVGPDDLIATATALTVETVAERCGFGSAAGSSRSSTRRRLA